MTVEAALKEFRERFVFNEDKGLKLGREPRRNDERNMLMCWREQDVGAEEGPIIADSL